MKQDDFVNNMTALLWRCLRNEQKFSECDKHTIQETSALTEWQI